MTLSDFRNITDELLSAYIDDEVTEQERALIEVAVARDQEIAWRLNSLRQTVNLLQDLPEMVLPRSFTLTFDQLQMAQEAEPLVEKGAMTREVVTTPALSPLVPPKPVPQSATGFWNQVAEGWRGFWQAGNPLLRNAAAVSFALMLFLAGGGQMLNRAMQPAGMMVVAPEAAPAAASESVALVPAATASAGEQNPTDAQTEARQVQDDQMAGKAPAEEAVAEEPVEERARTMQAPAESAPDSAATSAATSAAEGGENAAASAVVEDETPQDTTSQSDAAVQTGDAAVAAASSEAAASESAPAQADADEPAAAAAMSAPAQPPSEQEAEQGDAMPPLAEVPFPGGGVGRGESGGGMGGGPDSPGAGGVGSLVPEGAYGFDVDPMQPSPVPADEAVSASAAIAAAPEASAPSVADVAVTPAVDAPVEAAAASVATEAATEVATEASSEESADTAEQAVAEVTVEATPVATTERTVESTVEPTPEAIALVAPEAITSSEVVENVQMEGVVTATSYGVNLPVVWIAQGSALLLTVVLASLWWRSRKRE